ncbi:hypothetical protein SBA2_80029 [Acidobacteriia bacterium SbA2]|nr:hypothetical protein SBA2_80029 [Acidobacteriia bacterium SbA2]
MRSDLAWMAWLRLRVVAASLSRQLAAECRLNCALIGPNPSITAPRRGTACRPRIYAGPDEGGASPTPTSPGSSRLRRRGARPWALASAAPLVDGSGDSTYHLITLAGEVRIGGREVTDERTGKTVVERERGCGSGGARRRRHLGHGVSGHSLDGDSGSLFPVGRPRSVGAQ